MMKYFFSFILLLAFSIAQTAAQNSAAEKLVQVKEKASDGTTKEELAKPLPPKISQPLPFNVGENLSYDVSFERLIFSGTIGDLKFSVSKAENLPPEHITLKA